MRVFKGIIKSFLALFLLLVIFWTVALGILQTEKGQEWSLNLIKGHIEQNTNIRFEVGSVRFSFPLNLELTDIAFYEAVPEDLSQKGGIPLVTINRLELCCAYTNLLHGKVVFSKLQASEIDILHLPEETGAPISSSEKAWDAPLFPFYIKFSHIDLQNIRLSPEAINSPAHSKELKSYLNATSFDLNGMVSNNPFRHSLTAHLQLKTKSGNPDFPPLSLGIDAQNHLLSLSMHLRQIPLQFLYIDCPKGILGNLALFASAQIVDWQNLFQKHDPSGNFVEGHFKISFESQKEETPSFLARLIDHQTTLRSRFLIKPAGEVEMLDLIAEDTSIRIEGGALLQTSESKGSIDITLKHQNLPWHLAAAFEWKDPSLFSIYNLSIEGMNLTMTGYAACSLPESIWEGKLQAQTKQLEQISQFLPSPLKGEGQLTLLFSKALDTLDQKQQRIEAVWLGNNLSWQDWQARQVQLNMSLDSLQKQDNFLNLHSLLEGKGIRWKGYAVEQCAFDTDQLVEPDSRRIKQMKGQWKAQTIQWEGGSIAQAEGEAALEYPLEEIEGSLQFSLEKLKTSLICFSECTGSTDIHSDASSSHFHLKGKGAKDDELTFHSEGHWSFNNEKFNLRLKNLTGMYGPYPLALIKPVQFRMQPDEMQLSELHLQWGEGEIEADFDRKDKMISAQFKTNAVPSELFYFAAPDLPLTGRATLQGNFSGSMDHPEGQLQIDLHNVQIVEEIFAQYPFLDGKVLMELKGEGVHLQSELMGIGRTPLLASGSLPIQFSLNPFQFAISKSLPFDLQIHAEGDLDPYLLLFIHDSTNLAGHAKIALTVSGQLQSPEIKGSIDLTEGSYESLNTGAYYHHIQAHLEGDGSKILLTEFSAQDKKNGSLTATGAITMDSSKEFPFEFQIHPSQVSFLDSDYVSISASGPLTLVGNSKASTLQGQLSVDQATVRLEEALPKQIKSIDIRFINLPEEGEHSSIEAVNRDPGSTIALDVALLAKENILIQGNHLKSEWKGSIAVNGTPDNPLLYGELRVATGEYDFNGKIFNLNQGTIHFAGAPDKKTSLYIVASKDLDRIRADIIVKGAAHQPEISFRSNPPLSQREVLSYILFDRGISDITPDQGDQLSQSFISLNSNENAKGTDDFLSRLRNNIGIDRLDFTSSNDQENKDFGVKAGKYITENVIVSINQSMTSLKPVIAVEAKLPKNFKVQAEAGVIEDAPVQMSLKWKKDY